MEMRREKIESETCTCGDPKGLYEWFSNQKEGEEGGKGEDVDAGIEKGIAEKTEERN